MTTATATLVYIYAVAAYWPLEALVIIPFTIQ